MKEEVGSGSTNEKLAQVKIYSSQKQVGNLDVLREVFSEVGKAHSLGLTFAVRSFKSKYRQSYLGAIWAVIPPLLTSAIWIVLKSTGVIHLDEVGVPYPIYVVSGIMLWSIFSASIMAPMQTTQANRGILVKINFPREAIFFNALYEVMFNSVASIVVIVAGMIYFQILPGVNVLWFIPCYFLMIMLGMGIGLLLNPFALLFRDIQLVLPSILQIAMYLTPVLYAKPVYEGLVAILKFNPVAPLLLTARAAMLGIESGVSLLSIGVVAGVSIFLLVCGIVFNRVTMSIMTERMGS